jgi:hypothetical protein
MIVDVGKLATLATTVWLSDLSGYKTNNKVATEG